MEHTKLIALLEILRAHGITEYRTPELTLVLGPVADRAGQEAVAGTPAEVAAGLEPRVRAALDRLPAGYRDPALWNMGS